MAIWRFGEWNMTLENRLVMTLILLRQYPTYVYAVLSFHFGVGVTTVFRTIKRMWLILWEESAGLITWPDLNCWNLKAGTWPEMPNVLACIDGSSLEIQVPSTEPQEEFYSCHSHDNDAFAFRQMKTIGPGQELDFPPKSFILADSIYPNARPLVTPYKSVDIFGQPRLEQLRRRKFNLRHRKRRVFVERVIKEMKTVKVFGSIFRHTRWELACIVELCAALAKRKADLINSIEQIVLNVFLNNMIDYI